FHAEDGIRDVHVTGVQTCALPIEIDWSFPSSHATIAAVIVVAWRRWHGGGCRSGRTPVADTTARIAPTTRPTRSTATGALAQSGPTSRRSGPSASAAPQRARAALRC